MMHPVLDAPTPAAPTPTIEEQTVATPDTLAIQLPQYHVILFDDDAHTYEYVIEMLTRLFGHSKERAFQMAREVDAAGRVIVDTTTKERATLKRDQIHDFGPDPRIKGCKGSMSATIEPAD